MKLDVDKIKRVLEEIIENYEEIRTKDIDCLTLQPVRNLLVDLKEYQGPKGLKVLVIGKSTQIGTFEGLRERSKLLFSQEPQIKEIIQFKSSEICIAGDPVYINSKQKNHLWSNKKGKL